MKNESMGDLLIISRFSISNTNTNTNTNTLLALAVLRKLKCNERYYLGGNVQSALAQAKGIKFINGI